MVSVKEIIIVEGAYDKIKLSSFIDGIIFVTGGFSIMRDSEKVKGLYKMAEERGAVILTDSDSAGLRIRNFLKNHLPQEKIKHAFVPGIFGKERRKSKFGAEGLIGVEGMDKDIILKALSDAGCAINGAEIKKFQNAIEKKDLYTLGLSGRDDSKNLRIALNKHLGIPEKLSSNMLCEYLSGMYSIGDIEKIIEEIKNSSLM